MSNFNHSVKAVESVLELFKTHPKVVLAACPGAGKTWMSFDIIKKYIKDNPTKKVLVLTHGQSVLRSQYNSQFNDYINATCNGVPPFKITCIEKKEDLFENDAQVIVTLPHTIKSLKSFKNYGLIVVDEAHQFYFAENGMVQNILNKCDHDKELLLTATPSPFVYDNQLRESKNLKKNFEIYPISMCDLLDVKILQNIIVELATTPVKLFENDYNEKNDLKKNSQKKMADNLDVTLANLLNVILVKLKSINRCRPHLYSFINEITPNKVSNWLPTLGALEKTMIACPSIEVANSVYDFFISVLGEDKVVISHSENDKKSLFVSEFSNNPSKLIMVTVDRCILGFNLPSLSTVIDLTGTRNIDRIYQLMTRVSRKCKINPKKDKLFLKVSPIGMAEYTATIVKATACLMDSRWLLEYTGKNINTMSIPVLVKPKNKTNSNKSNKKYSKKIQSPINYLDFPDLKSFKDILHKDGSLLSSYKWVKIQDIRNELLGIKFTKWNDEEVIKFAKKFDSIKELADTSPGCYAYLKRNRDLFDDLFPDRRQKTTWNLELLIKEANKYSSRQEFFSNNQSCCRFFQRNFPNELDQLFPKERNWTLESAAKEAKKYKTRNDFRDQAGGAYNFLLREYPTKLDNIFEPLRNKWNVRDALKKLKPFKSINEAKRNGANDAYQFLYRNHKNLISKIFKK